MITGNKYSNVVGLDAVSEGAIAGPVVFGSVRLRDDLTDLHLRDSKALTADEIAELASQIAEHAIIGLVVVAAAEIDELGGLRAALFRGYRAALETLAFQTDLTHCQIVLDGKVNRLRGVPNVAVMEKADSQVEAVMAASIVAKNLANIIMRRHDLKYPGYNFGANFGFPVPEHLWALEQLGACPEHRGTTTSVREALARRALREVGFEVPEPETGPLADAAYTHAVESQGGIVLCRLPRQRDYDW